MKKALVVGINYVGTSAELRGCINDANYMKAVLEERGFDEIKMILENDATTAGIMAGLKWLVAGAVPGDVLFFHYSGHGSQIRSTVEPDGLDEIICPIDLNWRDKVITDNELKQIFHAVPNGVNVTLVLDCCHSGTALDQDDTMAMAAAKEMIEIEGARSLKKRRKKVANGADAHVLSRYLPPPPEVMEEIEEEQLEIRTFVTSRDVNRSALLIAGCAPHQTSADAFIEGEFQGAATYALRKALSLGKSTYRDITEFMLNYMITTGMTQRPQLDGHPSLYDQAFLQPWGFLSGTPVETPPPGVWVEPSPAPAPAPIEQPADLPGGIKPMHVLVVVMVVFLIALAALF